MRKLRLGFTSSDTEIAQKYGLTEFPGVVVLKTYDLGENKNLKGAEEIWYKNSEFKLPLLNDFLSDFARDNPKAFSAKQSKKEREKKSGKGKNDAFSYVQPANFTREILEEERAVLVYFSKSEEPLNEFKNFAELADTVKQPVKMSLFQVSADNKGQMKKDF